MSLPRPQKWKFGPGNTAPSRWTSSTSRATGKVAWGGFSHLHVDHKKYTVTTTLALVYSTGTDDQLRYFLPSLLAIGMVLCLSLVPHLLSLIPDTKNKYTE